MTEDAERTVAKPETKEGPLVKEIGDELGRIFRHTLPGIIILLAAKLSHPSWFPKTINYGNSWQLLTLAVVAIAIGKLGTFFTGIQSISYSTGFSGKPTEKARAEVIWAGLADILMRAISSSRTTATCLITSIFDRPK